MPESIDHLLKMAQEISDNITAALGPEQASQATAEHLQKFWSPVMRSDLVEALQQEDPSGHPDLQQLLPFLH